MNWLQTCDLRLLPYIPAPPSVTHPCAATTAETPGLSAANASVPLLPDPGGSPGAPTPTCATDTGKDPLHANLCRFWNTDRYLSDLHVTLLSAPQAVGIAQLPQADQALLQRVWNEGWVGARVEVQVQRLLCDSRGLCWEVSAITRADAAAMDVADSERGAAPGEQCLSAGHEELQGSLHVTLGTEEKTKAVYCKSMRRDIDRYADVLGGGSLEAPTAFGSPPTTEKLP